MLADYDMPGAYHMALDEVLLDAIIDGGAPVVRFYTWRPATLSLGVNQHVGEIDRAECEARGFGIVRRLTGGRAVLHQHELTYSVIARDNDPRVSGGVIESYRKISAALVAGLNSLGVDVSLAAPNKALFRAMSASRRAHELELSEVGPTASRQHQRRDLLRCVLSLRVGGQRAQIGRQRTGAARRRDPAARLHFARYRLGLLGVGVLLRHRSRQTTRPPQASIAYDIAAPRTGAHCHTHRKCRPP